MNQVFLLQQLSARIFGLHHRHGRFQGKIQSIRQEFPRSSTQIFYGRLIFNHIDGKCGTEIQATLKKLFQLRLLCP
jgi:hypothetical protein